MTAAKAAPLLIPKVAMATAIANSKLFDAAVKDRVAATGYALTEDHVRDEKKYVDAKLRARGLELQTEITMEPLSRSPYARPAAIRTMDSKDILISGNDFDVDAGAEGISIERSEGIRVVNNPRLRIKGTE